MYQVYFYTDKNTGTKVVTTTFDTVQLPPGNWQFTHQSTVDGHQAGPELHKWEAGFKKDGYFILLQR